jgi:DNA-binding GntR family transcriptional regulator
VRRRQGRTAQAREKRPEDHALDLRENPERIYTGGAVRFHAEILDAIVKRDPEKARAGIAADIKGASDFILSRGNLPD